MNQKSRERVRASNFCLVFSGPNSDVVDKAEFEEIFRAYGGVKCWTPGGLTSPLVLEWQFPSYKNWCAVKAKLDANLILNSAYIQGALGTNYQQHQDDISLTTSISNMSIASSKK